LGAKSKAIKNRLFLWPRRGQRQEGGGDGAKVLAREESGAALKFLIYFSLNLGKKKTFPVFFLFFYFFFGFFKKKNWVIKGGGGASRVKKIFLEGFYRPQNYFFFSHVVFLQPFFLQGGAYKGWADKKKKRKAPAGKKKKKHLRRVFFLAAGGRKGKKGFAGGTKFRGFKGRFFYSGGAPHGGICFVLKAKTIKKKRPRGFRLLVPPAIWDLGRGGDGFALRGGGGAIKKKGLGRFGDRAQGEQGPGKTFSWGGGKGGGGNTPLFPCFRRSLSKKNSKPGHVSPPPFFSPKKLYPFLFLCPGKTAGAGSKHSGSPPAKKN